MSPRPPRRLFRSGRSGTDSLTRPSPGTPQNRLSTTRRRPLKNARPRPRRLGRRLATSPALAAAAFRIFIQAHPDHTPLALDLYLSYQEHRQTARVQVFAPTDFHPRVLKRLPVAEDELSRPAKRPHIESSPDADQFETWTGGSDDSDTDLPRLTPIRTFWEDPCDVGVTRSAAPSYVVDLGLVKAFSTEGDDEDVVAEHATPCRDHGRSDDEHHSSRQRSHATTESHVDCALSSSPPESFLMRLVSMLSVFFIFAPCLLHLLHLLTALITYSTSPPPSETAIDWFGQASQIEIGLASVPRLVVFGDPELEVDCWRCQPGLQRSEEKINDMPLATEWISSSALYPNYKKCESASNGTFVPEAYFFDDLRHVLGSTLEDLESVATHGPSYFRFTPESIIRNRASTSPGRASLNENSSSLDPEYVFNLVASIAHQKHQVLQAFGVLYRMRSTIYERLPILFLESARNRARYMAILLDKLRWEADSGRCDWGSDQHRIHCLYRGRSSTEMPAVYKSEGLLQVYKAQYPGLPSSNEREASFASEASSLPSQPPCTPTGLPSPAVWSDAQKRNRTAQKLLDHLDVAVKAELRDIFYGDDIPMSQSDIIAWGHQLVIVCDLLGRFNDQAQQVVQGFPVGGELKGNVSRFIEDAVNRIHDVGPFLNEIALVRLRQMRDRANLGALRMEKLETQQRQLRRDIDRTLADAWRTYDKVHGRDVLSHFPAIDELVDEWNSTYEWIEHEYADVNNVYTSRMAEFNMHRDREKGAASWAEHLVIWSRWGLRDSRIDPVKTEALCWKRGALNSTDGIVVDSEGRATRCGDASARHG
ncbi:hypothetical protein AK830_g55 [Neonectria ditissima]|uniref:Uncharacterized protein n=1 Tax=Neonectria ditissima TaxID=78410 RepID=A0A0P7BHE9_9HYPO|nr:hypothetical protein AK830_g55 [Neonectria ditissima]